MKTISFNTGIAKKIHDVLNTPFANRIKAIYIDWNHYYGRGWGYGDKFVKQPAIAMTAVKVWFPNIPFWMVVLIFPAFVISWGVIGYIDRHYIKVWQKESEWGARKINPWQQELMKRIKGIEREVKKNAKRK